MNRKKICQIILLMGLLIMLPFTLFSCKYYFVKEDENLKNLLEPGSIEYYNFIAQVYYSRRQYTRAIFFYEKIIEGYSDTENSRHRRHVAWAYYEIGFCEKKRGRKKKALEFFELALTKSNDFTINTLALDQIEKIAITLKAKPKKLATEL